MNYVFVWILWICLCHLWILNSVICDLPLWSENSIYGSAFVNFEFCDLWSAFVICDLNSEFYICAIWILCDLWSAFVIWNFRDLCISENSVLYMYYALWSLKILVCPEAKMPWKFWCWSIYWTWEPGHSFFPMHHEQYIGWPWFTKWKICWIRGNRI